MKFKFHPVEFKVRVTAYQVNLEKDHEKIAELPGAHDKGKVTGIFMKLFYNTEQSGRVNDGDYIIHADGDFLLCRSYEYQETLTRKGAAS